MKKRILMFSAFACLIIIMSGFVLALDFKDSAEQLITWIKDIFSPFFLVLLGESVQEYLFEKILFLILLYVIVLTALKKTEIFKKNKGACILVAFVVSILSTRYITEINLIQLILTPYGTFGTSALVLLPFIIYGFFVYKSIENTGGRKLAWILFSAVFIGLWYQNRAKIGDLNWIYWLGILGVALVFIFDRQIHSYFGMFEDRKQRREIFNRHIADIDSQISYLIRSGADTDEVQNQLERLHERRRELVRKRGRIF